MEKPQEQSASDTTKHLVQASANAVTINIPLSLIQTNTEGAQKK